MELELQTDLIEALDGVDPQELLINDPDLAAAAAHIEDNDNGILLSSSFVKNASSETSQPNSMKRRNKEKSCVCVICGSTARGFRYYGAVSCTSCRAFFKRSIQKEAYKTFVCEQGYFTCQINSKSRKSCQLCRFNLSLQRGMIIPGENHTSSEFILDNGPNKSNEKQELPVLPITSSKDNNQGRLLMYNFMLESKKARLQDSFIKKLNNMLNTHLSIAISDIVTLEQILQMQLSMEKKFLSSIVTSDLGLLQKITEFSYLGTDSPIFMNKGVEDLIMLCCTEAFMNYSCQFRVPIKKKDLMKLARGNMPLAVEHFSASRIGTRIDPKPKETEHYKNFLESDSDKEISKMIHQIHVQASKNGKIKPLTVDYDNIYQQRLTKSGASSDELQRHRNAAIKLAPGRLGNGIMEFDYVVSLLTNLIIIYTPDFLDLDDPGRVMDVQAMYAGVLQRYLRSKDCSGHEEIFRNSMLASFYCRELSEIKARAYDRITAKR